MMRIRSLALGCLCLLGLGAGRAALAEGPPRLNYQEITLENGLRVLTLEDHSTPIVAVHLWYHVGSKDEDPTRQGFAHMFEHMMFRGTDRLGPTDHFDLIRRVGGECNASTSFDETVYVQTLPSNQLELALWLEAERMTFLKIDQDGFDTERKVVEEERRLGLNRPYGTLTEKALKEIFHKHPYRWSPIGNIPDLRAASVAELRAFWTKFYIPNNAALVIVGDIDAKHAQELAGKTFGWVPRYPEPPRVTVRDPQPTAPRVVTIKEDNAPTPATGLVIRTVPRGHADEPALDLLADILGGGESSRLNRELVIESRLAVFATSSTFNLEQDGLFGVGAVLPPVGSDLDGVAKRIDAQLAKLRNEPVTEQELIKSRNAILKQLVTRMLTVESKARVIGEATVIVGDTASVNQQYEKYSKLTAADLQRVAKEYLDPNRVLEGRVPRNLLGSMLSKNDKEEAAPITAKPESNPPAPGRGDLKRPEGFPAKPPLAPPKPSYTPPPTSEKVLANGLRVLVVPNNEVPFVTVQLGLDAGAWTESKPGTASLALAMLTKGTERHSQVALAEELETYAIDLGGHAGMDSASVSASSLPEHLERALGLLGEVVLQPTFPKDEFETLRQQVTTGLAMSAREPAQVASKEWRKHLYGAHPYARDPQGEAEDVAKATPEGAKSWWKEFARPDMATLIFAGDIAPERAFDLAEKALGSWKAEGPRPEPSLAAIPAPEPTRIYLVNRPGVQSQIRVVQRGLGYKDPGYATAEVASDYFGGSFSSRLNDVIRVKKGLTYGASGGNAAGRFAGRFSVSTFSKTESTVEALKAVLEELKRFRDVPPSEQELSTSQSSLVGGFAAQRETPQAAAGDLWLVTLNGLPRDFFAKNLGGIARATAEDCHQLVARMLDPDHLVIVVVGDAGKLKEGLEALAPVTVVE